MAGLPDLFAPQQAPDYSEAISGLQGAQDRITAFLSENAKPQTAPTLGEIGPMAVDIMRGSTYSKSLGNLINNKRSQALQGIELATGAANMGLQIAELKAKQGVPDAKAVWDALNYFAGDDLNIRRQLFNLAQNDRRDITAGNAWEIIGELAGGIQPEMDVPEGFMSNGAGGLIPIPGGPRDLGYLADVAAATRAPEQPRAPTEAESDRALLDQLLADGTITTDQYNAALMEMAGVPGADGGGFADENTLRDEFIQQTKIVGEAVGAAERVKVAASAGTAAGDIAMVFAFMKLVDPTSSVREGERADATNAAGVPQRIRAQYNALLTGESLTEEMRQDFVARTEDIVGTYRAQYETTANYYRSLAERNNLNPDNVIVPLNWGDTAGEPNGGVVEFDKYGNRVN